MSLEDLRLAYARNLKFINPNILSVLALLVSLETGYYFIDANKQHYLYIWIVVLLLLRLVINWTTKQIIEARGAENKKSYSVYYQITDKWSDIFVVGGFTLLSRISNFLLGYFGFSLALLVMFAGMLGKAEGVDYQKQGPMCKCGRIAIIALAVVAEYIAFKHGRPFMIFDLENSRVYSWMDLGIVIMIVLSLVTLVRRLLAIRKQVQEDQTKEW